MAVTIAGLHPALARAGRETRAWHERIAEELAFCDGLLEGHADLAGTWRAPLDDAARRIAAVAAEGSLDRLRDAVQAIETELAPLGERAKTHVIHAAGHAHLDMNWMWSWQETVAITHDTFLTVLQLMDEYPEFVFSQSQASCYRIIEQHYPELLDRIRARVREGRWEVIASHWVENDANLAGPAALCRHLAETRRYMADLFGLEPADVPVNWAPDTFGHAERGPSYLVRGGVKYQYLHRSGMYTPAPKRAFWWEAVDGARVLVHNGSDVGYNARIHPSMWRPLLSFGRETGLKEWFVAYGVGDHGGGPTRRDFERARELNAWPLFPRIVMGTAKGWFEWLEAHGEKLPTIKGELGSELTGCYTTQTLIKKANRVSENRLVDAGLAAALAGAAARRLAPGSVPAWPSARMTDAWRDVLLGHFHDILPGSCVHDARTYHNGLYQEVMATATIATLHPLRAFAARVVSPLPLPPPSSEDGTATPPLFIRDAMGAGVGFGMGGTGFAAGTFPAGGALPGSAGAPDPDGARRFVVFNLTAHDRDELVEAVVWENGEADAPMALKDCRFEVHYADLDAGKVTAQVVGHGIYWGHHFVRVAFPLAVPALGYAAVALRPLEEGTIGMVAGTGVGLSGADVPPTVREGVWQTGPLATSTYLPAEGVGEGLENDMVALDVDTRTGAIRNFVDKRSGLTLVHSGDAAALEFVRELPHGMSAWTIGRVGLPEPVRLTALRRVETGPWRAAIEVDLAMGRSNFTLTYALHADDPRLHVLLKGVWMERGGPEDGVPMLRWRLATTLAEAKGTYEVAFGSLRRDAFTRGEEVAGLEWAAVTGQVTDERAGAGKFDEVPAGVVVATDSKYGYSLDGRDFRVTLIRSSYEPDPLPEIGEHQVAWTVEPFAGALKPADAFASARKLNHPLCVVPSPECGRRGADPATLAAATGRFVKWSGGELCDLAPAADGDGLEVRAYEIDGRAQPLRIDFGGSLLGTVSRAEAIDLCGRVLGPLVVKNQVVDIPLAARGLAAARIGFTP